MLPEEVTKCIGQSGSIWILEVEKGAIKRFAAAIDDSNPLYCDEEYARNSRYGSIIAPPGFFGWLVKEESEGAHFSGPMGEARISLAKAGYNRSLHGGDEFEFFCPVRAGDTLVASSTVKDIFEREGKTGKMAFLITETTYTNQNGDLVAKVRGTGIHR